MDFEALLTIALVLFYFLSQFMGRKKQPKQRPNQRAPQKPTPTVEHRREPGREPDFDEALREIRTALGFPEPEEPSKPDRPQPAPAPVPASRPSPTPGRTPTRPVSSFETSERARKPVEFREVKRLSPHTERRTSERKPSSLAERTEPGAPPQRAKVLNLLGSPQNVRNAVILAEILGPPRSRATQVRSTGT